MKVGKLRFRLSCSRRTELESSITNSMSTLRVGTNVPPVPPAPAPAWPRPPGPPSAYTGSRPQPAASAAKTIGAYARWRWVTASASQRGSATRRFRSSEGAQLVSQIDRKMPLSPYDPAHCAMRTDGSAKRSVRPVTRMRHVRPRPRVGTDVRGVPADRVRRGVRRSPRRRSADRETA
jgi:hypothetical protein